MKIEIKKAVFEKFNSKFMAGILICSGLENLKEIKEVDRLLEKSENLIIYYSCIYSL